MEKIGMVYSMEKAYKVYNCRIEDTTCPLLVIPLEHEGRYDLDKVNLAIEKSGEMFKNLVFFKATINDKYSNRQFSRVQISDSDTQIPFNVTHLIASEHLLLDINELYKEVDVTYSWETSTINMFNKRSIR